MSVDVLFVVACAAAVLYGLAIGSALAGERVPVLSPAWELIRRPVDAVSEWAATRWGRVR